MSRRLVRLFAALLLPVLLLTGCWQDSSDPEVLQPGSSADTGAVSAAKEPVSLPKSFSLPVLEHTTLDPVTCPDGIQQTVGTLLYEGLYQLNAQMDPQPRLCSSASYDAASLTWTLTIRPGVTFSDGSALTAADAADTLRRAKTSSRYGARLADVKSVSAGSGTVQVVLSAADTALPALLDIPIVKSGSQGSDAPIGTGPYVYTADTGGAALTANPNWWGGSGQPVQRIPLISCETEDAARYQFTSHAVQLLTVDLTGTNPLSATGNFAFQDADTAILEYVGFNLRRPVFADAAVRRALGLGIDRDSLVSAYLSGHAAAAQFPISPVSADYPAGLESKYSSAAYQSALKKVGLTGGTARTLTLLVNSESSFKVAAAKYIASSLTSGELSVEVKALPWADYAAALSAGKFDLYYGEVRLPADWNLQSLLGTGGALNYGAYADATLDLLLRQYAASADRPTDAAALCRRLADQAPIVPICFKRISVLSQEGVLDGLTPTAADPFYGLGQWKINLAA